MGLAINLEKLVPGADYSGALAEDTRAAWEAIVWKDQRQKPTWEEVQSVVIPKPLAERLNDIFFAQTADFRGRFYHLKPALDIALKSGDIDGAKAIIANAGAEEDEEIRTQLLAEFDAS